MLHSSKDSVNILHWILFLNFRLVNKPNSLATMFPSSRPLCVNVCLQHVPFLWGRGLKGEHQLKQLFVFMKTGQREIKEGGLSCIFWWWWIIFLITVSQWIPRLKASWLHDPSWLVISGCAACVCNLYPQDKLHKNTNSLYTYIARCVVYSSHRLPHELQVSSATTWFALGFTSEWGVWGQRLSDAHRHLWIQKNRSSANKPVQPGLFRPSEGHVLVGCLFIKIAGCWKMLIQKDSSEKASF